MGFLSFLSPAISAASDVAGGYAQGQQRVESERRAQALAELKAKKDAERDTLLNALTKAQTRSADATADRGETGVTYQQDADGNIVALPTHLPKEPVGIARPGQPGPEGPVTRSDQGPKTADFDAPAPTPTGTSPTLGVKPVANDTTAVSPPKPPVIGTPTGIKGPKKPPVPGSPEWRAQKVQEAIIQRDYGRPAQDDRILVQVQQPDGSVVYMPRGEAAGQKAPSPNARGNAKILGDISENETQISVIDDAVAALAQSPGSVGLKRGMADLPLIGGFGDAVNQRFDPKGVDVRALIANIGSLVIKDRAGSAVTISESGRLRPFIPSIGDTPDAINKKLALLKKAIQTETDLLRQASGTGATAKPGGATAGQSSRAQQLWDAAVQKHGQAKVLAEVGPRP